MLAVVRKNIPPHFPGACADRAAPAVAIKAAPRWTMKRRCRDTPAEVELISLHGECKETMLWLGTLRSCARRATVLPEDAGITDEGPVSAGDR